MTRNTKGIIVFSVLSSLLTVAGAFIFSNVLSVLLPIVICITAMAGREVWQYKTGQAIVFEWDDIARYTLFILASSILTDFVFVLAGVVE